MPIESQFSYQTSLQGVYTEAFPDKNLTIRRTGFYQEYLPETASPRQAAYHSIVRPYVYGDTRVPHARLDAVPRLVSAPCSTSDKAQYVNVPSAVAPRGREGLARGLAYHAVPH